MEHSAFNAQAIHQAEPETVVVHVQLRPRRGATRKCLSALAALAAEHPEASFAVTGLSKDDRVVKVTVGRVDGTAFVEVVDDGVGGADPSQGSGLSGLADRVASLSGKLAIDSPQGTGTRIRAEIPLE